MNLLFGADHRGPDSDDSSAKSWNNRLWGRALHEWKVLTCSIKMNQIKVIVNTHNVLQACLLWRLHFFGTHHDPGNTSIAFTSWYCSDFVFWTKYAIKTKHQTQKKVQVLRPKKWRPNPQVLAHLVTVRYSPPSWRPLHWLSLVAAASGVALLLLSRGHYSIGQSWHSLKLKTIFFIKITIFNFQTCCSPTMWQRDFGISITQLLAIRQWGEMSMILI